MADENNKITQGVELVPTTDKSAANKAGQDIGNSVEQGIEKGIEKGAESGASKAAKTISKEFSSAAFTSVRDAIANSGSMKGKRAAVALSMPTSRDYALAKKRVGSGKNEGENEAINAAKGKTEQFGYLSKRLANAEKASQKNSNIRTQERETASRRERELSAKGELYKTQTSEDIRKAEEKAAISLANKEAKLKLENEYAAQRRVEASSYRETQKEIAARKKAEEAMAKKREAEIAAQENLQRLQAKSVSDSVRYFAVGQGRNNEEKNDYAKLVSMYKSMEGKSAADNAKTYGEFGISDAMKEAEHAWTEIANWFDNNKRDSGSQKEYSQLTGMYRNMQGQSASAVRAEYSGFTTESGSGFEKVALSLASMSPKLAEAYQSINKIKEALAAPFQSPLAQEIAKIGGAAASRAVSAVGAALGKLKEKVTGATSVFGRFSRVLVWRVYRVAAMKTLQAVAQGFKNLESYSEQFGTQFYGNMQEMKTSIQFVGNAFAAMVAPILNVVLPVLRQLADAVANIFNRIGQSIASALGQSQYSAALRTMVSDTKKSGGKMKDILGFDELNRLSGDTESGEDSSRMFEEWGAEPDATGVSALAEAWERVKAALDQVGQAFAPVGEALLGLITTVLPVVATLVAVIAEAIAPILEAAAPGIQAIVESITPLIETVLPVITTLLQTLSPFITRIVSVISNVVAAVLPGLTAAIGVVADVLEIVITVMSPVLDIIATVIETVGGVLTPIIEVVTAAIELVKEALDPVVSVVKDVVSLVSAILTPVLEIVKGVVIAVANVFGTVLTVAIRVVQAVIAGLAPVVEKIGSVFKVVASVIVTVWGTVKAAVMTVVEKVTGAWQTVKDLVAKGGEIFVGIKDSIASVFTTIVNGIIKGINWVIAQPFNLINGVLRRIKEISILGAKPFEDKISLISVPQIPLLQLASGGAVANAGALRGTLINVNEAGPEVVANQGRSTGVMNTDQMKAAIAEGNVNVVEAIYTMMASVVSAVNNKDLDVYLDAQKVGRSVTNYQNNYARQYGV